MTLDFQYAKISAGSQKKSILFLIHPLPSVPEKSLSNAAFRQLLYLIVDNYKRDLNLITRVRGKMFFFFKEREFNNARNGPDF